MYYNCVHIYYMVIYVYIGTISTGYVTQTPRDYIKHGHIIMCNNHRPGLSLGPTPFHIIQHIALNISAFTSYSRNIGGKVG